MQIYTEQELARMLAVGVPAAVVDRLRRNSHIGYHPNHHQDCFCVVCRGDADGHINDPCECGKCQR